MAFKAGNEHFRAKNYSAAILEYAKVGKAHPLYEHAQFNIRLAQSRSERRSSLTVPESAPGQPLLSIVMPVFNVAPYLDASINSALAQDCTNFELIIVNDASTDSSRRIIDMYASQDNRIKVIHLDYNTLGGAGIPSNVGIREARGKYLGFIDSDDWVTKEAFKAMIDLAHSHDAEIVIGDFCTFTEDDRTVSPAYDAALWDGIPLEQPVSIASHPALLKLSPVPWRKLYRLDFLRNHGIEYPQGDYFYEDNPLHWFVLTKAQRVVLTRKLVSYHRMGREGQTMTSSTYKLSAVTAHINTLREFIRNASFRDRQIVVDEFFAFMNRSTWIVERQVEPSSKLLISKRLSNIFKSGLTSEKPTNIGPHFRKKYQNYAQAYPDTDLTVVIPAFNSENIVSDAIHSVLKSRSNRINLVLIDDGSSDSTLDIIKKYEKLHDNVHAFTQGNKGAGRARNAVIPMITGEFTYFLDADDVVDIAALEAAVAHAKKNNHDLLFVPYILEYADEARRDSMPPDETAQWTKAVASKDPITRRAAAAHLLSRPWNRIIKTSLLHDRNIFFGPTCLHSDIPYHWQSVVLAQNIGFASMPVCIHRELPAGRQHANATDGDCMEVLNALDCTFEQVHREASFAQLKPVWSAFTKNLLDRASTTVPDHLKELYNERQARLIKRFKQH